MCTYAGVLSITGVRFIAVAEYQNLHIPLLNGQGEELRNIFVILDGGGVWLLTFSKDEIVLGMVLDKLVCFFLI